MNSAQHRLKINKIAAYVVVIFFVMLTACAALFFRSSGCGNGVDFTSGEHTIISNGTERAYYVRLPRQYNFRTALPLIFAFHGFSSDYTFFTQEHTGLQDAVGNNAILVYPNALPINGKRQWDFKTDPAFFDDLYAELEANLCFDKRKVFAVGHSNGAGFTHTLGCQRGNLLRAIAPVSGLFFDYDNCTGQVAVMMIQGDNDTTIPPATVQPTRGYWAAINSCSTETAQGDDPHCTAYSGCDPDFSVQYCTHSGGHDWPDFAGEAIWSFFQSLPPAAPSSTPGTGTIPQSEAGAVSFKILFPADFVGTPDKLALSLYPYGSALPLNGGPLYVLNMDVPLGDYALGQVTAYSNVLINLSGVPHGDYALSATIYVKGSTYPIPESGKDYMGLQDITIGSTSMVVEKPLELKLVVY